MGRVFHKLQGLSLFRFNPIHHLTGETTPTMQISRSIYWRMSCTSFFSGFPSNTSSAALASAKSGVPSLRALSFFSSYLKNNNDQLCLLQLCSLPTETDSLSMKTTKDRFLLCRFDNQGLNGYKDLYFPYRSDYGGFQALATCNGMVLLITGRLDIWSVPYCMILWNPLLRKSVIIEKRKNFKPMEAVGLGFDPSTGDYKVLTCIEELGNETSLKVEVYSLNTNSWKRLENVEAVLMVEGSYRAMTLFNGVLHFVAFRTYGSPRMVILGFDLAEEVFREIRLPSCIGRDYSIGDVHLWSYGECLSLLWFSYVDETLQTWVMKEYGVEESWTLLSSVSRKGLPFPRRYGISGSMLRNNGHLLFGVNYYGDMNGNMVSHDPMGQETQLLETDAKHACYFLSGYAESQVLEDKGDDLGSCFGIDSCNADDANCSSSSTKQ